MVKVKRTLELAGMELARDRDVVSNATINKARTSNDAPGRPRASNAGKPTMFTLDIKVNVDLIQLRQLVLAFCLLVIL